jgi:hypothetical protein
MPCSYNNAMKTRSLLAFVALMLAFPFISSHALERSVPLPYDYSRSINAGTYIPKCAVSETLVSTGSGYVCDSTLKKMASCMSQKKLYAPAQAGADANGCLEVSNGSGGATCGVYNETGLGASCGPMGDIWCGFNNLQTSQACPGATISGAKLICPSGYTAVKTGSIQTQQQSCSCSDHGGSSCTPHSTICSIYAWTCAKN